MKKLSIVRYEVITVLNVTVSVFWHMILLLDMYQILWCHILEYSNFPISCNPVNLH